MNKCKYEPKTVFYEDLKDDLEVPKFQRSLVWSQQMKKSLIETISNGYPFGTLLLYEKKTSSNKNYQLVDGLQRFTTLQDYEKHKYKYLDIEKIAKEDIEEIVMLSSPHGYTPSERRIEDITKFIIEEFKQGFNHLKIAEDYSVKFGIDKNALQIAKCLHNIEVKMEEEIDLNKLMIPIVIFKGDRSELPNIYDRINSNGTKLSKYEIFAAIWHDKRFKIDDIELLEKVDERYSSMIAKSGVSISGYEEGCILESKEINLFEYAYSVGKIVLERCPEMFVNNQTEMSSIDSIGFALLTVCVKGSLKQMSKLPTFFETTTSENMVLLKDKILECSCMVNRELKNFITNNNDKIVTKYLESQVVSLVGTLFQILYEIDNDLNITQKPNTAKDKNLFMKNMPKHYLYDIIKGFWAGSGDTKVNDLINSPLEFNKYLYSISDANWETTLDEWMVNQLNKDSMNINIINKLFLNFLLKMNISSMNTQSFDIEHIVPLNRLKNQFKNGGAFSAIGNLCYLPVYENRSKKDKTFYEFIEDKMISDIDEEELLSICYAEKSELDFIKEPNKFTKTAYTNFLKHRHDYLIKRFIEVINKI